MDNVELSEDQLNEITNIMGEACILANELFKIAYAKNPNPSVLLSAIGLMYATGCRGANMTDDVCHDGLTFFLENLASYQEAVNAIN